MKYMYEIQGKLKGNKEDSLNMDVGINLFYLPCKTDETSSICAAFRMQYDIP